MAALSDIPKHFVTSVRSRFHTEAGASLLEYAIVVGLIAVVALIAVAAFGGAVFTKFDDISSTMTAISGGG